VSIYKVVFADYGNMMGTYNLLSEILGDYGNRRIFGDDTSMMLKLTDDEAEILGGRMFVEKTDL